MCACRHTHDKIVFVGKYIECYVFFYPRIWEGNAFIQSVFACVSVWATTFERPDRNLIFGMVGHFDHI